MNSTIRPFALENKAFIHGQLVYKNLLVTIHSCQRMWHLLTFTEIPAAVNQMLV